MVKKKGIFLQKCSIVSDRYYKFIINILKINNMRLLTGAYLKKGELYRGDEMALEVSSIWQITSGFLKFNINYIFIVLLDLNKETATFYLETSWLHQLKHILMSFSGIMKHCVLPLNTWVRITKYRWVYSSTPDSITNREENSKKRMKNTSRATL